MRLPMTCFYRVIDIACIMLYLSVELSNAAPSSGQPHCCRQLQGVCRAASTSWSPAMCDHLGVK
jgi:hypothetical protein